MLVFSFFQNAAKVLYPAKPWEKCVQNWAFVAKIGYLWRNSGIFVAKFGDFDGLGDQKQPSLDEVLTVKPA